MKYELVRCLLSAAVTWMFSSTRHFGLSHGRQQLSRAALSIQHLLAVCMPDNTLVHQLAPTAADYTHHDPVSSCNGLLHQPEYTTQQTPTLGLHQCRHDYTVQVSSTASEVTQAANFAAEQLSSQSNSLSPFKVEEVLSARSKVVNGKSFELKLKLSQGNLPEQIIQVS